MNSYISNNQLSIIYFLSIWKTIFTEHFYTYYLLAKHSENFSSVPQKEKNLQPRPTKLISVYSLGREQ